MTHFVCGVIVPNGEKDVYETYVENELNPYSEYHEVDSYVDLTKVELEKEYLNYLEEKKKENKNLEKWEEKIDTWVAGYYYQELDEDGNMLSTFNEDSFFDWYNIGGRWDGEFTGEKENNLMKVTKLIQKFKERNAILKNSVLKTLKKIETGESEEYNPYLLNHIVCDGEAYLWQDIGWFGSVVGIKELKDWERDYLGVLEAHKEDYICFVDCHI